MSEVTRTNLKDALVRELFKGIGLRRLWKGEISLKEALIKCLDAYIGVGRRTPFPIAAIDQTPLK